MHIKHHISYITYIISQHSTHISALFLSPFQGLKWQVLLVSVLVFALGDGLQLVGLPLLDFIGDGFGIYMRKWLNY